MSWVDVEFVVRTQAPGCWRFRRSGGNKKYTATVSAMEAAISDEERHREAATLASYREQLGRNDATTPSLGCFVPTVLMWFSEETKVTPGYLAKLFGLNCVLPGPRAHPGQGDAPSAEVDRNRRTFWKHR